MLITRECDYAIRIIRALASQTTASIPRICEQEQISPAIAYKIARKLEQAGLIKSYRGHAGGYALNCNLETTSLYEVISVIKPQLLLTECMQTGYNCLANQPKNPCLVHNEFCRIQNLLDGELKTVVLANMVQR